MVVLPILVCCDREKRRLGLRTKHVVDTAIFRSTPLRRTFLRHWNPPPPGGSGTNPLCPLDGGTATTHYNDGCLFFFAGTEYYVCVMLAGLFSAEYGYQIRIGPYYLTLCTTALCDE